MNRRTFLAAPLVLVAPAVVPSVAKVALPRAGSWILYRFPLKIVTDRGWLSASQREFARKFFRDLPPLRKAVP